MVLVQLSGHIKRVSVSRMQDFLNCLILTIFNGIHLNKGQVWSHLPPGLKIPKKNIVLHFKQQAKTNLVWNIIVQARLSESAGTQEPCSKAKRIL